MKKESRVAIFGAETSELSSFEESLKSRGFLVSYLNPTHFRRSDARYYENSYDLFIVRADTAPGKLILSALDRDKSVCLDQVPEVSELFRVTLGGRSFYRSLENPKRRDVYNFANVFEGESILILGESLSDYRYFHDANSRRDFWGSPDSGLLRDMGLATDLEITWHNSGKFVPKSLQRSGLRCKCAITYTSDLGLAFLNAGIPVIALGDTCYSEFAWQFEDLKRIDKKELKDFSKLFDDLSWLFWSDEEILAGKPLDFLLDNQYEKKPKPQARPQQKAQTEKKPILKRRTYKTKK